MQTLYWGRRSRGCTQRPVHMPPHVSDTSSKSPACLPKAGLRKDALDFLTLLGGIAQETLRLCLSCHNAACPAEAAVPHFLTRCASPGPVYHQQSCAKF